MVLDAGKNTTKLNYINPNIFPATNPPQSSENFRMDCMCAPPRAHMRPAGRICAPWVHLGCICAPCGHVRPMCAPCAPHRGAYAPRGMHTRAPESVFLKLGGRSPVKYHRFMFIKVPLNCQFIKITPHQDTQLFDFFRFDICLIRKI